MKRPTRSTATYEAPVTDKATLDPPMTTGALAARRTALEARVASLRQERAASLLAGQQTDATALQMAQVELEAVDDAGGELVRRDRAEALAGEQAERRIKSARATALLKEWVAGIDDQEAAARAFVAALRQTDAARTELLALLFQLHGNVPLLLDASEQDTRRSHGLCAVLRYKPYIGRFGSIDLSPGMMTPETPWAVAERQLAEKITLQLSEAPHDQ